jgi:hypothetical protein
MTRAGQVLRCLRHHWRDGNDSLSKQTLIYLNIVSYGLALVASFVSLYFGLL